MRYKERQDYNKTIKMQKVYLHFYVNYDIIPMSHNY